MMPRLSNNEPYSEEETQRRFEAALRGARVAEAKPMKNVPRKRSESKRKTRKTDTKPSS